MTSHTHARLLLCALAVAMPSALGAQSLSRADAVSQALAANPEVKISLAQVATLEGRITEERADALPDISWSTRAIRSRDPGLLNSPNFDEFPAEFRSALFPKAGNLFDSSAEIRQTLFSFKLGNALKAARLARVAGQQDVSRARQTTALRAVQSYNQLLFALEQLRVTRTTIEQKQGHLDTARNRRAAGAATELEVLRAEVDLENQRAELLRAETQVTTAQARLNTVMVRPTNTAVEPTDRLDLVPVSATFDDAVREALATRPELAALRTELEVRDRLIDVTRADMKPRIDFDGAYGFQVREPQNLFHIDFARWSAAVTVKVPLFDGKRTSGKIAQARADRDGATQRIAALENQIRLDVQSAWDAVALADRTLKAADLNITQARRAASMTEANYRQGAATPLDVLDAQQALVLAEDIRNQALYTHANARAQLSFEMGRDPLTDAPVAP